VGDNFHADVEGAHNAGLIPILIDPTGLYPEPGCTVITAVGQLPAILGLHDMRAATAEG